MSKVVVGRITDLGNAKPAPFDMVGKIDTWMNHKGGHRSLPKVDCPVCADLKAARLDELLNLIRKMVRGKLLRNPYHKKRLDSTREHHAYLKATNELLSFLNDRIAKLEKV